MTLVTYEQDNFGDDILVTLDQQEIAVVEWDGNSEPLVCYGTAMAHSREFPSLDAAKRWIERNAEDLADPDARDRV